MAVPPQFASIDDSRARRRDVAMSRPHVVAVLRRHGLDGGAEPEAGYNPTYPTFVCGDVVVKLFGGFAPWRAAHAAESAAHALVSADPDILAPPVLAEGQLFEDQDSPWPYLVTARAPGCAWRDAALSAAHEHSVAAALGAQVRRLHALPPPAPPFPRRDAVDVADAARRSSLPPHLAAQAADYVAALPRPDPPVFVHADLMAAHVFVEGGRLAGIIDWGDAAFDDRHVELIQVHRDLFECDTDLLRVFLDAAGWPVGPDFPRLALGHAIRRQAIGLAQHHSMDVFEPVAAKLPLAEMATLDELATALFGLPC